MAIRFPCIIHAKHFVRQTSDNAKGRIAVYVGDEKKRFVLPISYMNQPSFQELLIQAEEEFGFDHPTGGLTLPRTEDFFTNVISPFKSR